MSTTCLPAHGRVDCVLCHKGQAPRFDRTATSEGNWRITANPLAWGSPFAEVVVLGFSKGPTQAGSLASTPHDAIAFKGGRLALGRILAHVGLLPLETDSALTQSVDRIIADTTGRFHFGSLIRCTVEQKIRGTWTGTGGGMLDKFVGSSFGAEVAGRCAATFLGNLPLSTRIVVMLGMGAKGNYITESRKLFAAARPRKWTTINEVSYSDGAITVVHVEHFKSQGALIPNWLSGNGHPRGKLGLAAKAAIAAALRAKRETNSMTRS
jgi:hypothetical protein